MPICPKCGNRIEHLVGAFSTVVYKYRDAFYDPLTNDFEVDESYELYDDNTEDFEYFMCPKCNMVLFDNWVEALRFFRQGEKPHPKFKSFEQWAEEEW